MIVWVRNLMSPPQRFIVEATYSTTLQFLIPAGIDLEDTTQVHSWRIKYGTLYYTLTDGCTYEITDYYQQEPDFKDPDDTTIIEAEEHMVDPDGEHLVVDYDEGYDILINN